MFSFFREIFSTFRKQQIKKKQLEVLDEIVKISEHLSLYDKDLNSIPSQASAFTGIPNTDEVDIPSSVTQEITKSLQDDEPQIFIQASKGKQFIAKFDEIENAAKWAQVRPSDIRRVLDGKRKTSGGYSWKLITKK